MEPPAPPQQPNEQTESLEGIGLNNAPAPAEPKATDPTPGQGEIKSVRSDEIEARSTTEGTPTPAAAETKKNHISDILQRINVYLLIFGLVITIGIAVTVIAFIKTPSGSSQNTIKPQNLSASQLELLASGSTTIGSSDQVLNIEPNSIFSGQVLIRKDLDVAGTINVSSALNLSSVTVSGTANIAQIQAGKLSVSGNASIQGQVAINNTLDVSGASSFSGTVTANQLIVQSLDLSDDLTIASHILVSGTSPNPSPGGSALGNGGTVSLSGTDTAGAVTINTGSSPGAGCFITVTFAHSFSATPYVVITPVGSAAGGLAYYITRATTNFSICSDSAAPASTTFGFDYVVL